MYGMKLMFGVPCSMINFQLVVNESNFEIFSVQVMISDYDAERKTIRHRAVNACLAPLASIDGHHVITVEGIGSTRSGLHRVQVRYEFRLRLLSNKITASKTTLDQTYSTIESPTIIGSDGEISRISMWILHTRHCDGHV